MGQAKVFAHRGSSGQWPENTMLAFRKAMEEGADGIENDVHLSKDGEVMIIHDESLARTAGVDSMVWDLTRSELERISAGRTQQDRYGFTPIPSLDEYLTFMEEHRDKVTNIELKTAPVYYPGIEEKVLELVRRHGLEENVIYSSFNWLSVVKMKRMDPTCKVGLLFSGDFNDMDGGLVKALQSEGRQVNMWTVNETLDIRNAIEWGVDGIITNHPLRVLHEQGRV